LNLHFIYFFFTMLMSWTYTWELTPSSSWSHNCHWLNSLMTNLQITPLLMPSLSIHLLHFLLLSTLKPTWFKHCIWKNPTSITQCKH
jgi:hypothetical protein